jgi:hypothetical protein
VAEYDLVLVPTGTVPDITATTMDIQNVKRPRSETDSWLEYFGFFWNHVYLMVIDHIVAGRLGDQLASASGSPLGAPPAGKFFCFTQTALTLCP